MNIEKRRYHIHVTYFDNKDWEETLHFRNFLRSDAQAVKEYENIKKEAIKQCKQNGEIYRKLKQPFIEKFSKEK
jgi:GrpB-like predicted nucleotidyltransferase (UPF0157 family)